jgi:hypothetical protein
VRVHEGGISPTGTMSRMPMVVVGGRERLSVGGSKKRKKLGAGNRGIQAEST